MTTNLRDAANARAQIPWVNELKQCLDQGQVLSSLPTTQLHQPPSRKMYSSPQKANRLLVTDTQQQNAAARPGLRAVQRRR